MRTNCFISCIIGGIALFFSSAAWIGAYRQLESPERCAALLLHLHSSPTSCHRVHMEKDQQVHAQVILTWLCACRAGSLHQCGEGLCIHKTVTAPVVTHNLWICLKIERLIFYAAKKRLATKWLWATCGMIRVALAQNHFRASSVVTDLQSSPGMWGRLVH